MMRRSVCWLTVFLVGAVPLMAGEPSLAEARKRFLRGNLEESRRLYESLQKEEKFLVAATIGLSRILEAQGEYEKGESLVDAAVKKNAKQADLLARQAELLYKRGRWTEAEKAANDALEVKKDHFLALWVRAQIYRDRGDIDKADQECRWFVRTYTERSQNDDDIKDPDTLLLVGLAGIENARFNNLSDQFEFVLKEVFGDALKYDPDFWPAEVEAGRLLLEKYNRAEALPAFDKALAINPNAAEALAGKGWAALAKMDFKDADQFAQQALKINPHLVEALCLHADIRLAEGDFAAATKDLNTARSVNSKDEETLGRLSAIAYIQHRKADWEKLNEEATRNDPKPAQYYFILAQCLEERRWYDDAEEFYKKAAELRPKLAWAENSLGLLYMRLGREKEAREILTKAFEIDPFNVRVSNSLKVLRHLEKYQTLKTAHFELRYDPKTDSPLAKFMGDYLEGYYGILVNQFGYEPKDHILIEVFNNHQMFSGRTIALPDLHTIGACTGKMMAMVSSTGKGISKPFNWTRVLRHELTHIFNLEQTHYLVPHWFTEGLAVINEGFPRPALWNQLLVERVPAGPLMNLDTIDLGFIRPKSPKEWALAYCQSQIYVEYLKEKYGPDKVGGMLAAYRDGLSTGEALRKVCQADKAEFEKGYMEYIGAIARSVKARPPEKPMSFKQLKEAHEKNPADLQITARLAEASLKRDKVEARKLAESVLAVQEDHPLALLVKAKLFLQAGDAAAAREILKKAADQDSPDPRALLELGKLAFDAEDYAGALGYFERGRKAEPLESQWLVQLARVHAQMGDAAKQIAVLKDLAPLDADDLDTRKRLARLLLENKEPAEAERFARQALEINVMDGEARSSLYQALSEQKKEEELKKIKKILEN